MLRLPLRVLTVVLLAACADPPPPPPWQRPAPPGLEALREAVAALDAATHDRLGDEGWPAHLPRSRDFPERPLVRTGEVEDLGRVGADTEGLTRALEDAVRDLMQLRLVLDEVAVPLSLRPEGGPPAPEPADGDDAGPAPAPRDARPARRDEKANDPLWATRGQPPRAGLLVEAWVDRRGRVRVTLTDVVLDEELAKATSRRR